jgi:hypothetical protein
LLQTASDKLSQERYIFVAFGFKLVLDEYVMEERKSTRARYTLVKSYSRLGPQRREGERLTVSQVYQNPGVATLVTRKAASKLTVHWEPPVSL